MSYDNCSLDLNKLKEFCDNTNVYFALGEVFAKHLYKNLSISEFNKGTPDNTLQIYKDSYLLVDKYFDYFQKYAYTRDEKLKSVFPLYLATNKAFDAGMKFIDIGTENWSSDYIYNLTVPVLETFDNDYTHFMDNILPLIEEGFMFFEKHHLWDIFFNEDEKQELKYSFKFIKD